ncbi:3758_t:CDS:1, partial [Scutellospora calospora]
MDFENKIKELEEIIDQLEKEKNNNRIDLLNERSNRRKIQREKEILERKIEKIESNKSFNQMDAITFFNYQNFTNDNE